MQEVSGVYSPVFQYGLAKKMALRAWKVSGPFEKQAPRIL